MVQADGGVDQLATEQCQRALAQLGPAENWGPAEEHFAIVLGTPDPDLPLVRLHSECITGDVFGSQLCDCGHQLKEAVRRLAREGALLEVEAVAVLPAAEQPKMARNKGGAQRPTA